MKLIDTILRGFRSFHESTLIKWEGREPGVYYVTGQNLVEPELGANGVGKSSLFDAVAWGFYGKTSRGLKGPDLKSWNGDKQLAVLHKFEHNGAEHEVARTWSPNSLTLDGNEVDQQTLDRFLGISYEAYLHTIYFAQFGRSFLDLGPTDRMSLFSDVLGLSQWEKASDNARDSVKLVVEEINKLDVDIARVEGEMSAIDQKAIRAQAQEWEASREERLKKARLELNKLEEEKRIKLADDAELTEQAANIEDQDVEEIQQRVSRIRAWVIQLDLRIAQVGELVGGAQCYVCGQAVTEEHKRAEAKEAKKEQEREEEKYKLAAADLKAAKVKQARKDELNKFARVNREQLQALDRVLKDRKRVVDEINAEHNPFGKVLLDAQLKAQELHEKMVKLKDERTSNDKLKELAQY
jgi:DNA repair exonuclease SbcCD ATPase subunit